MYNREIENLDHERQITILPTKGRDLFVVIDYEARVKHFNTLYKAFNYIDIYLEKKPLKRNKRDR